MTVFSSIFNPQVIVILLVHNLFVQTTSKITIFNREHVFWPSNYAIFPWVETLKQACFVLNLLCWKMQTLALNRWFRPAEFILLFYCKHCRRWLTFVCASWLLLGMCSSTFSWSGSQTSFFHDRRALLIHSAVCKVDAKHINMYCTGNKTLWIPPPIPGKCFWDFHHFGFHLMVYNRGRKHFVCHKCNK